MGVTPAEGHPLRRGAEVTYEVEVAEFSIPSQLWLSVLCLSSRGTRIMLTTTPTP